MDLQRVYHELFRFIEVATADLKQDGFEMRLPF
jgi:hypothetical protein